MNQPGSWRSSGDPAGGGGARRRMDAERGAGLTARRPRDGLAPDRFPRSRSVIMMPVDLVTGGAHLSSDNQ